MLCAIFVTCGFCCVLFLLFVVFAATGGFLVHAVFFSTRFFLFLVVHKPKVVEMTFYKVGFFEEF